MSGSETPRDARLKLLLSKLRSLTRENRHAPTVRELADAVGRSVSPVHKDLYALRRDGLVEWEDRKPRTLRIVRPAK